MEKALENVAAEALRNDRVTGYLCADNNGLCLAASGVADKAICPTLVRIAKLASKLDENKKDSMVLGVDTVGGKIYLPVKQRKLSFNSSTPVPMVFHINPRDYVPIQLIDAHDPIFAAISPIDSNGTFAQNQIKFNQANDQWFRRKFEDLICIYNSILKHIDDGIYDSKNFRLVFNSIAATCKAKAENLSLYQTSAFKSSVIQSINQSIDVVDDDDDHLMFRPLTIDDGVDTLGITVFAT
ncbi:hypothetical protein BLOT_015134 [Blomia tropicalis]|nr:hypothetical protein BLOT_015134 [Blomia tropicalis]